MLHIKTILYFISIAMLYAACNRCSLTKQDFSKDGYIKIILDTTQTSRGFSSLTERDTVLIEHRYHANSGNLNRIDTFLADKNGKFLYHNTYTGKVDSTIQLAFPVDQGVHDTFNISVGEYHYQMVGMTGLFLTQSGCNNPSKLLKSYLKVNGIQSDVLKNYTPDSMFTIQDKTIILRK